MLHILVTGGTGFIGQALCTRLLENESHITVLTRSSSGNNPSIKYIRSLDEISSSTDIDVCVNLAGDPLFSGPWTSGKRQRIRQSRLQTTQNIYQLNKRLSKPIPVIISGSAIGIYGDKGDIQITESSITGTHFGAQLCYEWEQAALQNVALGSRVCLVRSSIVIGNGGALIPMKRLFKLGLGAAIATGRQYWPWISLNDEVAAILFLIQSDLKGPVNFCSPTETSNIEFTKILATALNRPLWLPNTPAFILKWLTLGSSELLTDSVRLQPEKLLAAGFKFEDKLLDQAIAKAIA